MAGRGLASVNKWELDAELKEGAGDGTPRKDDGEAALGMAAAKANEGADHGDVPEDRRDVGYEEEAMAIEDAQTPRGKDEEAHPRKHDLDEMDGEDAEVAVKAGGDEVDEHRGQQDAEENDDADANGKQAGDDAGDTTRKVDFTFGQESGVDGDEGGGEDAFAQKVLEKVGDLEGGGERASRLGIAQVISEDARAHEARNTAQKNARTHQQRGGARLAGRRRGGAGNFGFDRDVISVEWPDAETENSAAQLRNRAECLLTFDSPGP